MKNLPNLEGRLVTMGPFTPEHVPTYHGWLQDDYILRMTDTDRDEFRSVEDVARLRDEIENASDMIHYIIFDKETKKPIGDAYLDGINDGCPESAIMIADPKCRNRGYATEAMRLLLDYGFRNFNLKNIRADVPHFNEPSIAWHKKLGFKEKKRDGDDIIFELERTSSEVACRCISYPDSS